MSREKQPRAALGGVDEISIDRSLLAVVRETEWRMKAEMAPLAPAGASVAFEGLDDVDVGVYLDPPPLVSDVMEDGALPPMETLKKDEPETILEIGEKMLASDGAIAARLEEKVAQVDEGTYFDLLEVTSASSEQEIRAAYERLRSEFAISRFAAAKLAPLRGRAEKLLSVVDEAYAVLCDPSLRDVYTSTSGGGGRRE